MWVSYHSLRFRFIHEDFALPSSRWHVKAYIPWELLVNQGSPANPTGLVALTVALLACPSHPG